MFAIENSLVTFAAMNNPKRYLVTAALPYANGPVHIGHLAGCYLPADIYVRYLRSQNKDVKFIGGSDEHGVPITIRAMKEGITPQDVVDRYHAIIKDSMVKMGISFDIYSRTSNKTHHETASAFFKKMYDDGCFEERETEQYFDETTNTFLADRYITGTCPVCANPSAYGDQCEKCGTDLSPEQLINPKSALSDAVPVKKKTTHWYFPLQNYEPWLKEWIIEGHKEWKNNVYGQCKSWIDKGLQPRAMTRDSNWGIKVPKLASLPSKGGFKEGNSEKDILDYLTADPYTYGILRKFADEHKSNPTVAENILWQVLRGKKLDSYKFRRQHIIGNFIADFVCLPQKLIIEVDGLIHQIPENKINDAQRIEELNKFGFDVLRFTNDEVVGDIENVLDKILQKISEKNLGIESSQNPPLEGREAGKVLYVWFDAPIGYISATKELTENWADYWCKDDTKLVHFIGKDNIVFHCIIFPAMLKAHGGFVLPENVPANEFLNIEGEKVSTSRNWAVWVHEYAKDFEGCEDVLRYVLCANAPETKDNDFTWKDFQDRNNSELVSVFGNFVNRTWVLMHKLCGGKVPVLHQEILDEKDKAIVEEIKNAKAKIEKNIEEFKFRDALFEVIDISRKGNKYLQEKEPWIVAKKLAPLNPPEGGTLQPLNENEKLQNNTDLQIPPKGGGGAEVGGAVQKSIDNCLHICLQLTANLAIYANPFLPNTAKKLLGMMKVVEKMLDWENGGRIDLLKVGYTLRAPELLFRKIEDEEITMQVDKLKRGASLNPSEGGTLALKSNENANKLEVAKIPPSGGGGAEYIEFSDFAKIDLKVGTITAAEKVEKADKLLKLEVDLGFEVRIIVSGIALHFEPSAIVGKQVVVVTNLATRKMRGIESNGMILMAENKDGSLKFVAPSEAADNGSGVS
jgi:methionine--tRNA ligase beta chain